MRNALASCIVFGTLLNVVMSTLLNGLEENMEPTISTMFIDSLDTADKHYATDMFSPVSIHNPLVTAMVSYYIDSNRNEKLQGLNSVNLHRILKAQKLTASINLPSMDNPSPTLEHYHIFILVSRTQFEVTAPSPSDPQVTVLRIAVECSDCYRFPQLPQDAFHLVDSLELPRIKQEVDTAPTYITETIQAGAPSIYMSSLKNHNMKVAIDSIFYQALVYDREGEPVHGIKSMHYVQYQVNNVTDTKCVAAILHAPGINALLFSDLRCYYGSEQILLMEETHETIDKQADQTQLTTVIAIVGFICSMVSGLVAFQQRRRRYGYLPL